MGANRQIEQINLRHLAVPLVGAGFRRRGRVWTKVVDEAVWLVEVLLGKWNEGGSGRFTIELGVMFPGLVEAIAELEPFHYYRPYLAKPAIEACQIRERIGFLLDSPVDHWWEIDATTALETLGQSVAEILERRGLTWFGRQPNERGFGARAGETPSIFHLAALVRAGEAAAATTALTRYLGDRRVQLAPGQADAVLGWARQHGINGLP